MYQIMMVMPLHSLHNKDEVRVKSISGGEVQEKNRKASPVG